jgi:hypothetical protein
MEEIVFGDAEPKGDASHPLFHQLMIARRSRNNRSRAHYRAFFQPTISTIIPNLEKSQRIASATWDDYLSKLPILCLTETHEDPLMWAHYADCHTGAVVQFECVRERDSVLLAALPVKYTERVPYIGTMDEWICHLTGKHLIDYDLHFQRLVTTKSPHWAYEREWRLINFTDNNDDGRHMFDRFWPEEIEAVYFGCRVKDEDIRDVLDSRHPSLSHLRAYKAKRRKWEFGLDFERMH